MKLIAFAGFMVFTSLAGCDGTNTFNEVQSTTTSGQDQDAEAQSTAEEALASEPVMIGGAFLRCREADPRAASSDDGVPIQCGIRISSEESYSVAAGTKGRFEVFEGEDIIFESEEVEAGTDKDWPFMFLFPGGNLAERRIAGHIEGFDQMLIPAVLHFGEEPKASREVLAKGLVLGDGIGQSFTPLNSSRCQRLMENSAGDPSSTTDFVISVAEGQDLKLKVEGTCGVASPSELKLIGPGGETLFSEALENGDRSYDLGALGEGEYTVMLVSAKMPDYSDLDDFYIGTLTALLGESP